MTKKLPLDTKNYLVLMIENKIENSPQDSVFQNKKLYEEWYNPMSWEWVKNLKTNTLGPSEEELKKKREKASEDMKKVPGGFGESNPQKKKQDGPPSFTQTLMGDSEEVTGEEENPLLKVLGAAGMIGAGGVAGALGKKGAGLVKGAGQALDKFGILGKMGGSALKYASRGVASLGKQAEEISGKTWVEAQLGKIGQSQMELAAQGAGSPWTKFVIPEKKPSKIISPQERQQAEYDAETERLAKEMKARDVRTKAKQQGLIP